MKKQLGIRGHHLTSIKFINENPLAEVASRLVRGKYVKRKNDPFVDFAYNYARNIRNDLNGSIKIIAGTKDAFCQNCPVEEACPRCHGSKVAKFSLDQHVASQYGFEIGKVYSVREIIEKLWR